MRHVLKSNKYYRLIRYGNWVCQYFHRTKLAIWRWEP